MAGNVEAIIERLLPILPLLVSQSLSETWLNFTLTSLHADLHGSSLRLGVLVSGRIYAMQPVYA